jgi:hypothetical protein
MHLFSARTLLKPLATKKRVRQVPQMQQTTKTAQRVNAKQANAQPAPG